MDLEPHFQSGLSYHDFLQQHGSEEHRHKWAQMHAQITLSDAQRGLLASFKREMKVLCLAGAWCGDCVHQCPVLDHFEAASPAVTVRYVDRDASPDLAEHLRVCGAPRVPAVVFLDEDGHHLGRYGDRTLARYRHLADAQLGPSCPTGLAVPEDALTRAVVQEWLDQFERIQLMLRLSPRLRSRHGD